MEETDKRLQMRAAELFLQCTPSLMLQSFLPMEVGRRATWRKRDRTVRLWATRKVKRRRWSNHAHFMRVLTSGHRSRSNNSTSTRNVMSLSYQELPLRREKMGQLLKLRADRMNASENPEGRSLGH
jgi:hypothetical protein